MKKTALLILACAACGSAAMAQQAVVKEAEKAMKAGQDYTKVYQIIAPAMQNAETANEANTYYIPGKAGFKQYDNLLGRKQLGMLKEGEGLVMATALLGGYDNFIKVLPLDTVVDAKGKVKTKYSKDIVSTIAGHYNDFTDAAAEFWNAEQFENAYRAWGIFVDLSKNPTPFGIKAHPDTIVAQYMFNRALAAYRLQDNQKAIDSFREAAEYGYPKPEVYEYGISVALQGKDNEALYYFASKGNEKYGKEDPQYINSIINYYLREEKYDDAINYIQDAIAASPDNAQYYALAGIIYDNKKDNDKALSLFAKALEKDSENPIANFYYGRALLIKAGDMSDNFSGSQQDYPAFKETQLYPMFREGAEYLEKAYKLDPDNRHDILRALSLAYYNLNDEAGIESVKQRQMED